MNLIQINERLKDLPMQVVQQYANGMNPEVPPYLALGELQRRELSQKQMATAQGGAQGPQPSVKEQVEQKAGLMALQQMQKQMSQQQARPSGPMPVPAGAPQPQAQPQAMARGGLTSIPVRRDMFNYASGGIIAFSAGSKGPVSNEPRYLSLNERAAKQMEEKGGIYNKNFGLPRAERERAAAQEAVDGLEASREGYVRRYGADRYNVALENAKSKLAALPPAAPSEDVDNRAPLIEVNAPPGSASVPVGSTMAERLSDPRIRKLLEGMRKNGVSEAYIAQAIAQQLQTPDETDEQYRQNEKIYRKKNKGMSRREAIPMESIDPAIWKLIESAQVSDTYPELRGSVADIAKNPQPAPPAQGLPAALPTKTPPPPPANNKRSITPVGQNPAKNTTPLMAEALTQARAAPEKPTAAGVIAEQNALLPEGMQEAAMKKRFQDQRTRADERQDVYDRNKSSGLDDLIRVFGQAGQYKGLSGLGPAYSQNKDRRRKEEMDFQKQQDELMTNIEGREYDTSKELFSSRDKSMVAANKSYQDRLLSNTKTLADLAGVDQRRMDEAAGRLSAFQVAKLREATANKPTEAERIEAKYIGMVAEGKKEEADAFLNRIAKIKGGGNAGVGAGRNANAERRQRMDELKVIINDEGDVFSEEEKAQAAKEYKRLAIQNAKGGDSGGGDAPKIGDIQDGFRFKGGDPAVESNWEKVK